jgi:hypothetical protein
MKRNRFTEEQIIGILREQEAGQKTSEVCRKHGTWCTRSPPAVARTRELRPLTRLAIKPVAFRICSRSGSAAP